MGQVRHGGTTTTHVDRAALQRSHASLAQLSGKLGIDPTTSAKCRKQATFEDLKNGPMKSRSTVLTEKEEAIIVAFQKRAAATGGLPLCLSARTSAPDAFGSAPTNHCAPSVQARLGMHLMPATRT